MSERVCAVPECDAPYSSRGWCRVHYARWQRHGDPTKLVRKHYDGCVICGGNPVQARGWCQMHYARWLKHGDPETVTIIRGDDDARLWQKVDASGDCWEWTAAISKDGYGHFRIDGTTKLAHRVAYEALVGPIPDGLTLDHLCRTPACVNPDHLEPVTQQVNAMRGYGFMAQQTRRYRRREGKVYEW